MKSILVAAFCAFLALPAPGKDKPKIQEKYDAPTQTTIYWPTETPKVRAGSGKWSVYPSIGAKSNGSKKWFILSVMGGWLDGIDQFEFTLDGEALPLDVALSPGTFMPTVDGWSFADVEPDLRIVVRRIVAARDVWLLLHYRGGFRLAIHLSPEQIGVFRLMLEKFDSLKP
jgi:hypothetical protein